MKSIKNNNIRSIEELFDKNSKWFVNNRFGNTYSNRHTAIPKIIDELKLLKDANYTNEKFIKEYEDGLSEQNHQDVGRKRLNEEALNSDNKEFLLHYDNIFIKNIVDKRFTGSRKEFVIGELNATDTLLSRVIVNCKAMGFNKIYIIDTSCRVVPSITHGLKIMKRSERNADNVDDDPVDIGDMVEFKIPEEWSNEPGKILTTNTDGSYTIEVESCDGTPKRYSKVKNIEQIGEDRVGRFKIPGRWSLVPGKIKSKDISNNTYTVEVNTNSCEGIKEYTNVSEVRNYIKPREWFGGKKKRRTKVHKFRKGRSTRKSRY
jgi:hypothetical protein